jgi:alkanesulfonate monooxygenase SsuD/methylene tetrahydromethanopterin reductase-like flavin-dependent oxidoreductase (luciferase family)
VTAAERFARARPRLLRLAYSQLGDVGGAEDVVQEAWLRLARADAASIGNLDGWLTTVVARLALDRLTSAAARRETYVGPWLPEPRCRSSSATAASRASTRSATRRSCGASEPYRRRSRCHRPRARPRPPGLVAGQVHDPQVRREFFHSTQCRGRETRGTSRCALVPRQRRCGGSLSGRRCCTGMKKIGFLSFGHWSQSPGSLARTASDALLQSIELAVAAEELGVDGAYFRVHHFAQQLASPFPLLAAVGARTSRIEIGTGVIDMRYENPLYMAEDAGAADLISGGRLQLGISRGSPEQVIDGFRYFGYVPAEDSDHAAMAREHAQVFLDVIKGEGFARPNPRPMFPNPPGLLRIEPHSPGLPERIWWGAGTRATAEWTAQQGLNLMSSTLLSEDTGVPFHQLQAEQIQRFRDAWKAAGHEREPRVSVSRSIFPIVDDRDRMYFGSARGDQDQVGYLDGGKARFGKTYAGEPEQLVKELADDEAVAAADTLLLTIPNQLGVDYNAHLLDSVVRHVAPELGWR